MLRTNKCLGLYDYACSFVDKGAIAEIGCGNVRGARHMTNILPRNSYYLFEDPFIAAQQNADQDVYEMNRDGKIVTLIKYDISTGFIRFAEDIDGKSEIELVIAHHVLQETQYWEQMVEGMSYIIDQDGGLAVITVPFKPKTASVKDCGKYTVEHNVFEYLLKRWFQHVTMNFAKITGDLFRITDYDDTTRNCVLYVCA